MPLTPELFEARLKQLLAEEAAQPLGWWYLSYADEKGFRGGVIMSAHGFTSAVYVASTLKISPGGEVQGIRIPPEELPAESYHYRLLTLEELTECWGEMKKMSELEERERE